DVARLLIQQPVDDLLVGQHAIAFRLVGPGLAEDFPEDLIADRLRRFQLAAPLATHARLAEHLLEALAGALASHLHQTQFGDPDDIGLGVVALQLFFQSTQDLTPVLLVRHVDEIDDDDAADIAQAQLPGNGSRGFEVGLEDGFLQGAMTNEGAGIDVDGSHRFSRIDDQVATGLEHHLAIERLLDFIFDAVQIENRPFARVMLQVLAQFRHEFINELPDLLEVFPRIDANLLDTRIDQVAE